MMERRRSVLAVGQAIYIGVDLHHGSWHITIRTQEQVLHTETLPPQWAAFAKVLLRYGAERFVDHQRQVPRIVSSKKLFGSWGERLQDLGGTKNGFDEENDLANRKYYFMENLTGNIAGGRVQRLVGLRDRQS